MQLIPECQRPVSGTEGALQRRRKLLYQLPVYDQDPLKCQSLASEKEVRCCCCLFSPHTHTGVDGGKWPTQGLFFVPPRFTLPLLQISSMLLFVKQYKEEVLGVGEVALPGEGGTLREAAAQRAAKEPKEGPDSGPAAGSTNGTSGEGPETAYVSPESLWRPRVHPQGAHFLSLLQRCSGCQGELPRESPAVYAERAGYHGALWHPGCFVCSACGQGLVDLVYFWSGQKLFCGRHYCESVWPRCCACDEVSFASADAILAPPCATPRPIIPERRRLFPSADRGPVVSHRKRWPEVAQRARLLLEVWAEPGAAVPTPDFQALARTFTPGTTGLPHPRRTKRIRAA